jgi:molecular chaperone DnaK
LRDKVAFELGIASSTDVNPMTAVAEGAAIFAESIDWTSHSRGRKSSRGTISVGGKLAMAFNFIARTPNSKAKIAVKLDGEAVPGAEFQIDSLDTGWSSGHMALKDGATVEVTLSRPGENTFKIFVFDAAGGPISLESNKILITRTAATIDAIPSSSSIGIEVLDKLGGRPVMEYLVRVGEPLPQKGEKRFKATESLRAGGLGAIDFKIWEGEIEEPVTDNRFVGALSITGADFDEGVIAAGAELVCEYEILDSGNVLLEVSVPSIGSTFHSGRNFYPRQEGQIDFTSASKQILEDAKLVWERLEAVTSKVDNPKLEQALEKLAQAASLKQGESDPETCKQAMDNVLDAKKLLAQVRKEHLKEIRWLDLDRCVEYFNQYVRQHARPTEASSFDNLVRTAQRAIESNSTDFENHLDQLRGKKFQILWRQDGFVVNRFR